jgi:predicted GIY-YIG superfamily endonuclease
MKVREVHPKRRGRVPSQEETAWARRDMVAHSPDFQTGSICVTVEGTMEVSLRRNTVTGKFFIAFAPSKLRWVQKFAVRDEAREAYFKAEEAEKERLIQVDRDYREALAEQKKRQRGEQLSLIA